MIKKRIVPGALMLVVAGAVAMPATAFAATQTPASPASPQITKCESAHYYLEGTYDRLQYDKAHGASADQLHQDVVAEERAQEDALVACERGL